MARCKKTVLVTLFVTVVVIKINPLSQTFIESTYRLGVSNFRRAKSIQTVPFRCYL
jgi:hypothetical protein